LATATSNRAASPVLELSGEATPMPTLLRDLWAHRGLLPMLAAKDFHARYRSATLGVLWSVLLPLLQGGVFAVVFTRVVGVPHDDGISYPVFVISGMVMWSFFTQSLTAGSTSIVDGGAIAGKVYFPRSILPAVPVLANTVSLAIAQGTVLGLMLLFGVSFGVTLLLLPVAMVLTAAVATILAEPLALLHVYFRDVRYVVQAGLLIALYASPVIYPLDAAGDLRPVLLVNPMTGALQLTRFAVFGEADALGPTVAVSVAWIIGLGAAALLAFRRHERIAMDRL
jgi:lipopolysaccharide transport system permease protein